MSNNNLLRQIEQINAMLRAFGPQAVQEIKMMKDGRVVGQIRYGYRPQYVFDAVNFVIQPENWRYEVVSREIFDFQAVAEVKLFLRVGSEWLCKGSHTGQMNIINKNVGDAYKGAVTDAIQKCLSLLSVGCDAYRGLLEGVYKGNQSANSFKTFPESLVNGQPQLQNEQPQLTHNPEQQITHAPQQEPSAVSHTPQQQPVQYQQQHLQPSNYQTPAANSPGSLPQIAGIEYHEANGRVVAVGKSFDKKELLKSAGFRWDGAEKNWYKEVAVH